MDPDLTLHKVVGGAAMRSVEGGKLENRELSRDRPQMFSDVEPITHAALQH